MSPAVRPTHVGVFDSGVGGISVLNELRAVLPGSDFTYVADQAHCPYGDRPAAQIVDRAAVITDFLVEQGADVVVVACNTATVAAIDVLRSRSSIPLVGTEPPVKPAAAATRMGAVGVLATSRTLDGAKFGRLVETHAAGARILVQPCPGLADRVEAGDLDGPATRAVLERRLEPFFEAPVDVVVLGSTHYVFLRPLIEALVGDRVTVLDPVAGVVRRTRAVLDGRTPRLSAPTGTTPTGVVDGSVGWFTTSHVADVSLFARLGGAPVTLRRFVPTPPSTRA